MNQEQQFLQKLLVGLHVTGRQPARGPEIGSIKVSYYIYTNLYTNPFFQVFNSIYSARNLYVLNGRMCFLTTYDKAQRRRGNTEYIIRCLPDKISQILIQYLVYVRPFARALDQRETEYLFASLQGPWAGEELKFVLSQIT